MKRWIACFACVLLSLSATAQTEEPHQNIEIKTIMERYKQGEYFGKIAAMSGEQRRKLMAYYQKGKAAGVKDRLLATGMGSLVSGYADIEGMRAWVAEYKATNRVPKQTSLPLPYLSFTNAAEKFPEAQTMFASELEATKKMETQVKSILEAITVDAEKRIAALQKSIELLDQILKAMK